jgi:hypothetical protein
MEIPVMELLQSIERSDANLTHPRREAYVENMRS